MQKDYADINAEVITHWIKDENWVWGRPIGHEEYVNALAGKWDVVLTPTKPVPHEWFGDMRGKKLLGLASGGGQQMPLFAALGADCTVMDYTPAQLESERMVAEREGYDINIVRGDMSKTFPFQDEQFDIIFHPVSNVYIRDVYHLWRECFRVLKKGGILLAGLDNGINFMFNDDETRVENSLPFDPVANEAQYKACMESNDGMQFSHTFAEQIGGQLKAGFTLVDAFEDTNGEGFLHEMNIPTFWVTKAVK